MKVCIYPHYTKGGERNEFLKLYLVNFFLNLAMQIESLSQEESLVRVQFLLILFMTWGDAMAISF